MEILRWRRLEGVRELVMVGREELKGWVKAEGY